MLVEAGDQAVGEFREQVRSGRDAGQPVVDRSDEEDESGVLGLDRLQPRQVEGATGQGSAQRGPQRLVLGGLVYVQGALEHPPARGRAQGTP